MLITDENNITIPYYKHLHVEDSKLIHALQNKGILLKDEYELQKYVDPKEQIQIAPISESYSTYKVYSPPLWNNDKEEDRRLVIDFGGFWVYNLCSLIHNDAHLPADTDGQPGSKLFLLDIGRHKGIEVGEFRDILNHVILGLKSIGITIRAVG